MLCPTMPNFYCDSCFKQQSHTLSNFALNVAKVFDCWLHQMGVRPWVVQVGARCCMQRFNSRIAQMRGGFVVCAESIRAATAPPPLQGAPPPPLLPTNLNLCNLCHPYLLTSTSIKTFPPAPMSHCRVRHRPMTFASRCKPLTSRSVFPPTASSCLTYQARWTALPRSPTHPKARGGGGFVLFTQQHNSKPLTTKN